MNNFDDFMVGPQVDELEVNEFDLDFDEPDDEEYYNDGSELFSLDLSNVEGTVDDILEDLNPEDPKEKRFIDVLLNLKKSPHMLEDLKNKCIDNVCDSETICNYISDYSISELGDMDGIWNVFGDILRDTVYEYFNFNEEE